MEISINKIGILLMYLVCSCITKPSENNLDMPVESIQNYIDQLDYSEIDHKRQQLLDSVASLMNVWYQEEQELNLTFICTHNSRRSQLSQVWAQLAAKYYNLNIHCFSGGTEETAFNIRAVNALKRAGVNIEVFDAKSDNIRYKVSPLSTNDKSYIMHSKVYDDTLTNPQEKFVAIMTCDHADQNCPYIPGADHRVSWSFIDPKVSDNTPKEESTYDERCRQIATEMFYVLQKLSKN